MEKVIQRIHVNKNIVFIILLSFAIYLSDGILTVVLPSLLVNNTVLITLIGSFMAIQSFLGVFLFLPQATFISKKGEKVSLQIGLLINVVVYMFYFIANPVAIVFGKFSEGFGDRLLNSTVSKIVYDETDDHNNRGRIRALIESVGQLSLIIGPAIAGFLIVYSPRVPILLCLIMMISVFGLSFTMYTQTETKCLENHQMSLVEHYKFHIKKYLDNSLIVWITIPSILLSSWTIFYSLILNVYLLGTGVVSVTTLGLMWSTIAIISIALQVPSGILADTNKKFGMRLSLILVFLGFGGLCFAPKTLFYLLASVLMIYTGGQFYTASMSALFGDLTTKENRLSESESYRMFRAIGEGFITLLISLLFGVNVLWCLILIGVLSCAGIILALKIYNMAIKNKLE